MTHFRHLFYHFCEGKDRMRAKSLFLSVFSLICANSAFAVRVALPVVDVTGTAISARAAYGEVPSPLPVAPVTASNLASDCTPSIAVAPLPKAAVTVQKTATVARNVAPRVAAAKPDILMPQRPRGDIWAANNGKSNTVAARATTVAVASSTPSLRMPAVSELARLDSGYSLPPESLNARAADNNFGDDDDYADAGYTARASKPIQTAAVIRAPVAPVVTLAADASDKNAELESRVAELEQKLVAAEKTYAGAADTRRYSIDDVRARSAVSAPQRISSIASVRSTGRGGIYSAPSESASSAVVAKSGDISVRRVVVPMNDEFAPQPMVARNAAPRTDDSISDSDGDPLTKLSPSQLKQAFRKTYMSENKHLSTYPIDDSFDTVSTTGMQGFDSSRDLSEDADSIRVLEIKIGFRDEDSALTRDNYSQLAAYADLVVSNPKRAIQISIPERNTRSFDGRKLAARRLAIIEQVLRDAGISDARIMPVLASRNDDSFVLRVVSSDVFQTMVEKKRDMFGDVSNTRSYKSMSW